MLVYVWCVNRTHCLVTGTLSVLVPASVEVACGSAGDGDDSGGCDGGVVEGVIAAPAACSLLPGCHSMSCVHVTKAALQAVMLLQYDAAWEVGHDNAHTPAAMPGTTCWCCRGCMQVCHVGVC